MKLHASLIAGSLALNGAGLAALIVRPSMAPPAIRTFVAGLFKPTAPASTPAPKSSQPPPVVQKKLWPELDTAGDLNALISRLRRAGFPAEIIRAMVQAELSSRYDTRMRAIFEPDAATPFWKLASNIYGSGDNRMETYGQLQRERAKLQRELFADPFFSTDDVTAAQRRQYGNLSRQKIDLLQRIDEDYAEMNAALRSATNGILLAEDREKLALLQRERRADLAAALTPQELADYEMRSSPISSTLTRQLATFNASEAEFRAIFQSQQAYSDKVSGVTLGGGSNFEERQAAQKQLNEQLQASLGPSRYADYLRETDSTYQQLVRLVQRENLPPDTSIRAFNVRDTVAQESSRIADDPALNSDQKRAALQALAARTRTELLGMLGPGAGPTYVTVIDGRWLTRVERGSAVSFTSSSGSSMMYMSGSSSIPVSTSFGLSPTFRSVTTPVPAPRP